MKTCRKTNPKNLPTSRAAALHCGFKKYFTGKVCVNGHMDARYTSGGECQSCVKSRSHKVHSKKLKSSGNTNSSSNRVRIDSIKDTGEYKEVWED